MIKYPEGLPRPQRSGYGFQNEDSNIRTPRMAGRERVRPGSSRAPSRAAVMWKFSNTEAQLFEAWYAEILNNGTAWFEVSLKHPTGHDVPYKAQFAGMYDGPELEGRSHWIVSATLVLFERPVLRGGWALYAPQFVLYAGEIDRALNEKWPK